MTDKRRRPRKISVDELMTVEELSAKLKVKPSAVYFWVRTKRIPCIKLGGHGKRCRIMFVRSEIERWLGAQYRPSDDAMRDEKSAADARS